MLEVVGVRERTGDEGIGGFKIETYGKNGIDYSRVFTTTGKVISDVVTRLDEV